MTNEELEEAERLRRQINHVIDQLNRVNLENAELDAELNAAILAFLRAYSNYRMGQ